MATITLEGLKQLLTEGNVVLLEALPPMYYEAEHLPGAKNLPLGEIDALAPILIPDKNRAHRHLLQWRHLPQLQDRRSPTNGPRLHRRARLRRRQRGMGGRRPSC